jgi:hypothetical protein
MSTRTNVSKTLSQQSVVKLQQMLVAANTSPKVRDNVRKELIKRGVTLV